MKNFEALIQIKAFARQDSLFLTALWLCSFLFMMYAPETGIGNLLLLATPILVIWRMIAFRNYALEGSMSYKRALGYTLYVFFYACLLFALLQFLYLEFIDSGQMLHFLQESVAKAKPIWLANGMSEEEVAEITRTINSFTSIDATFFFFMNGLFLSILSSFVIALAGMKK